MRTIVYLLFLFPLCAAAGGEKSLENPAGQNPAPAEIAGNQRGEAAQSKGAALKTRNVLISDEEQWGMHRHSQYKVKKISFTDVEDLLTKVPSTDLQKSLVYQGFFPEFSNDTDFLIEMDYLYSFNEDVNPDDLKMDIEVVNPQKAFEFAKRAYLPEEGYTTKRARMAGGNLANCYLSGIGTERNVAEAVKILKNSPIFKDSIPEILNQSCMKNKARFYYPPLIAYLCYKGIGVEPDIERCNAILRSGVFPYCWQNFYIGYLVPKDFDFAIYCLKILDEKWADEIIIKIYAGEYNPKHKDPVALKKYQDYVKGKKYQHKPKKYYRF